jgi:hypothetical protein
LGLSDWYLDDGGRDEKDPLRDFKFYQTLWSLQAYFADPLRSFSTPAHFATFTASLDAILSAFEASRLSAKDALAASAALSGLSKSIPTAGSLSMPAPHARAPSSLGPSPFPLMNGGTISSSRFSSSAASHARAVASFPKYLTSSRLLNLQLRDPFFRRHILLQCIILFHFLNSTSKKPSPPKVDTKLLATLQQRVTAVLRDTPPHGADFTREIEQLLTRERSWSLQKDIAFKESFTVREVVASMTSTLMLPEVNPGGVPVGTKATATTGGATTKKSKTGGHDKPLPPAPPVGMSITTHYLFLFTSVINVLTCCTRPYRWYSTCQDG